MNKRFVYQVGNNKYVSTWCLKCYTTVAFHFLKIKHHTIRVMPEQRGTTKGQRIHATTGTGG